MLAGALALPAAAAQRSFHALSHGIPCIIPCDVAGGVGAWIERSRLPARGRRHRLLFTGLLLGQTFLPPLIHLLLLKSEQVGFLK